MICTAAPGKRSLALALLAAASLLAGCAAGVTSSGPGPTPITVVVSGPSTDRLGMTAQFTAAVTGTSNTGVIWQVNGVTNGSASTGAISTAGLYTAPSAMPSPTAVTITAVSKASASSAGSLTLNLQNPFPTISGATATQAGSSLNYAVDIIGSGFVPGSIINAGGTAQTTTYVSATELQATVAVASGTTSINLSVTNPNPGGSTSATTKVSITFYTTTATAAARLLDQATFGPTMTDIQHVQQVGLSGYLQEQFAQPTTPLASIPTSPLPAVCLSANNPTVCEESEWWTTAIRGPDQLRQRVAFALSEMFVVSTQGNSGASIPQFHNALANDAFGNFSKIMKDVALSPAMGGYLNMLNSAVAAAGQIPNENFARENMQLFTIGTAMLNQDGTPQLDGSGNPIQPYTETQIQAFAKAYTGWTYATSTGASPTKFPNKTVNFDYPMAAVESAHDTTSKALLNGTVLPAGQTAEQDLDGALGNIFNHTNVGPFVCKQLIQHLVTSTPSPAYVTRVAAVFANNGSGVRGDMKAVLTAILTDQEARAGDTNASYDGGHLREPILFLTAMIRGLGFTNTDVNGSFYSLSNQSVKLGEEPYRANSVFNFFPPSYVIPDSTINAPEFGIENTATATLRQSLADTIVSNKISGFTVDLSATSALGTQAATPATLVTTLSTLLMHSQMPSNMQTAIISAITPLTSNAQRVRVALYLVITSSQYKIIH
ncbi:MAG: DUF1800 domain-containing protein [Acidobacteriota bacterium]